MTLIDWLRKQLDADEAIAEMALKRVVRWSDKSIPPPWERDAIMAASVPGFTLERLTQFADPARVLAEVKAKRAILDECVGAEADVAVHPRPYDVEPWAESLSVILFALAQPYRDREGWQDEWSVTE